MKAEPIVQRRLEPFELQRLALYYILVAAALWGLALLLPGSVAAEAGTILRSADVSSFLDWVNLGGNGTPPDWLRAGADMTGALLLVLPLGWVYVRTRTREKFDRSLIPTVILLPIIVTAIVVVVRDSLALAFSLTGIVAAVRFRNNLKESNDAVYIFGAIAIGFAAGIQALAVAGILSVFLTTLELALWRFELGGRYARTYVRLCGNTGQFAVHPAPDAPVLTASPVVPVSKRARIAGTLAVSVRREPGLKREVERVIAEHAKRWEASKPVRKGNVRELSYQVELRRRSDPATLQTDLFQSIGPSLLSVGWMSKSIVNEKSVNAKSPVQESPMRALTAVSSAAAAALLLLFASPVAAQGDVPQLISVESTIRMVPAPTVRLPSSGASTDAALAVGRFFADAVLSTNWRQAAIVMHPEALVELKAAVREEAEGRVDEWPLSLMPGVRSIEDFDRMSPAAVFVGLMRLVDARKPDLTAGIVDIEVQRATVESGDEAVVTIEVTRRNSWGESRTHRDEIKLELLNNTWRVQPTGQVKKMMAVAAR